MGRLFISLLLSASFQVSATVTTVGKGGGLHLPAIAVALKGFTDTKVDSDKDNYTDTWIVKSKKQMQVHFLNKQRIYRSIFYYSMNNKLLMVDVEGVHGKNLSKIYLIPNPKMNLVEDGEITSDVAACDSHNDGVYNFKNIFMRLEEHDAVDSMAGPLSCSILAPVSKVKIGKIIDSIVNLKNQKCQMEALNKYLPNPGLTSAALTSVVTALNHDRDLPENGLFQCLEGTNEESSSRTVPDRIKLKVSNGFIDSSVNEMGLRHEYTHLVVRNACLVNGKSICNAVSTDEELIRKINDDVKDCLTPRALLGGIEVSNAKVGGVAEVAAAHIGVMSEVVTEPLGAPLATLQLESAQGQPVSVGQINTLAYLPVADVLAKDPAGLEQRTLALARPMLDRGDRIYREVRDALGSELDVLPAAGASDLRVASASRPAPDSVGKFDERLADIASRRVEPSIKPVTDRGTMVETPAASAATTGKLTQGSPETVSNRPDRASGVSKEQILAGDKAQAGGLAAAATGIGASSSPGMSVRQGGGKAPGLQAQSTGDRNPAAIDTKQLTPEAVAAQISSLPGRDVLARLQDGKFYSKVAKAKIAVFDLDNNVLGAPLSSATDCYIIRSLDRKPTPINCTQRRKR